MRIFELEICRSEDSGKFKRRYLLAAALLMSLPIRGLAQITIQPAGSLRIEGDSSLHKWSSTATVVTMTFQSKAGVPKSLPAAIKASKIETLEVVIPIAGLKSGESGLDRNLRKAMKVKQFPDVVYHLEHYQTTKGTDDGALSVKTEGKLTIAGKTKSVNMDVEFQLSPAGAAMKGSYTLNMSDYGIEPPTLFLGSIKVRDPITIRFDLLLQPESMETQ
jgi:polyisoprenoid-binding protein YceI